MPKPDPRDHEARTQEAAQLVTADRVQVSRDEFWVIRVTVDGKAYDNVRPAKAFPLSHKSPYVSFINDKGKEVALLANPHDLDDESRQVVQDALELNYFVPRITRVHSLSETWGVTRWEVDTDCGRAVFEVIDREKIRNLANGGIIIIDADENRFMIDALSHLDPRSQNLVMSET